MEDDALDTARELVKEGGSKLRLPVDMVIADKFANDAQTKIVDVGPVPDGWRILDVGPETVKNFSKVISEAGTVVWNGPMGVFEMSNFAKATFAVAKAVADSNAISIIGGGDSRLPLPSPAWQTRSRISPPAAAPRWKCWKASNCPVWPH